MLLITLGLLVATTVIAPVAGRADTGYPVLLVHGGIGSPADFNQMVGWLKADGYRPYPVADDPEQKLVTCTADDIDRSATWLSTADECQLSRVMVRVTEPLLLS